MAMLHLLLIGAALAAGPHWKPSDDALRAYDRGVEALDAARLDVAERRLREALVADPDCGACAHALGVTLLRRDDAEEAVELLQELARLHPQRADVMISLADAAFGSQDFALSIEAAAIALVLDATAWDALTAMVRACLRTGDTATARRWLDSASGAHPDDRLACLKADMFVEEGDVTGASAMLEKCELSRDDTLIAHVRARVAAASGDYTALVSQAHEGGNKDLSRFGQAFAEYEEGSYRKAASLLRLVLADNPSNAEAALFLGLSEYHQGHSDKATEALTLAFGGETWISVDRQGGYSGVVTAGGAEVFEARLRQGVGLLVQLQVQQGDLEGAAHSLDRAKAELEPCAEVDAGRIALLAARGEPQAAAVTATRALAAQPGVPMLEDAVRDLLLNHRESRSPELLEATTATGMAEGPYWAALTQRDLGAPLECLEALAPALVGDDAQTRPTTLTLAWACAVEADEVERADGYRELLLAEGASLDADVSLNHTRLLLAAGQFDGSLALLRSLELERNDRLDYARNLEVMALIGLGDTEQALATASAGDTTAETRFELALALLRAERIAEATPLLAGCCEGLELEDNRTRCRDLLLQVEGLAEETR